MKRTNSEHLVETLRELDKWVTGFVQERHGYDHATLCNVAQALREAAWRISSLESEWGSADEALIAAGKEASDLPKELWMLPDHDPLYPRINQLNIEGDLLREAAHEVCRVADTHSTGDVQRGVHDPALNVAIVHLWKALRHGR